MNMNYLELEQLEASLWLEETRFDVCYMNQILAEEFIEFGRSGRIHTRQEILSTPSQSIRAVMPLQGFKITPVSQDVVMITYVSELHPDPLRANRSSLWMWRDERWQLFFHQGTPVNE